MDLYTLPLLANLQTVSLAGLVVLSGLFFLLRSANKSQLPLINSKRRFEFGIAKARQRYLKDAHSLITSGLAKVFVADLGCLSLTNLFCRLKPFVLLPKTGLGLFYPPIMQRTFEAIDH